MSDVTNAPAKGLLKDLLPAYKLPPYVEFLDAVPQTETEKKIQRNKLQYLNESVHDLRANPRGKAGA